MATDPAQAEFETRQNLARSRMAESRERVARVADPEAALMNCTAYALENALCSSYLGRFDETKSSFRDAARWTIERLDKYPPAAPNEGIYTAHALSYAILSQDRDLEAAIAAREPPVKSFTPVVGGYFRALRALLQEDVPGADAAAAELSTREDKEVLREQWYPKVGAAVDAITKRNSREFYLAEEAILEQHLRYSKGRGHLAGGVHSLLCIPAICLAILARRCELAVEVPDRFHRAQLHFKVRHIQEWRGERVFGQKLETTVDLLPDGLLK